MPAMSRRIAGFIAVSLAVLPVLSARATVLLDRMRTGTGTPLVSSVDRPQTPRYDLVIAGGGLIDGSGRPRVRADVAIKGGKIVLIGSISGGEAAQIID